MAWDSGAGEKDRIGGLSIGLNPRAELGFIQNPIVRGAVSILTGGNEDLGGANGFAFGYQQTLGAANLTLDGKPIVKAGKLLLPRAPRRLTPRPQPPPHDLEGTWR